MYTHMGNGTESTYAYGRQREQLLGHAAHGQQRPHHVTQK